MAIAAALPGFNDLGRSVTPTFLSRNIFYSQLSSHCPKMNKNSVWEVKKKIQDFCPRDIEFCHLAAYFFNISDISNSSTLSGKSLRKKSILENFRAIVLK